MKKLSKQDIARRDAIIRKLADAALRLAAEHEALSDAVEKFNGRIDEYNEQLEEARGFAEDMVSEMDNYMSERSERWQDGDTGQAYSDWKSEWENVELDELEHVEVPELPSTDHGDALEQAPEEPNV
ncbi:hypothetical protein Brsp07_04634 [Brucella sp. NBRC 14130]|uniref:hypothetical protein n=1 Tax=Brucella sp. NBRC 14130 TaxID=3075483 RepID=UPI0030954BDD